MSKLCPTLATSALPRINPPIPGERKSPRSVRKPQNVPSPTHFPIIPNKLKTIINDTYILSPLVAAAVAQRERHVIEEPVALGEGRDGPRAVVVAPAATVQPVQGAQVAVAVGQPVGTAPLGARRYHELADPAFRPRRFFRRSRWWWSDLPARDT